MRRYRAEGGMSKPHKNNPDDFPEFNLNQLERYANRWVEKYSIIQIEKITLYLLNTEYQEKWLVRHSGEWPITQYGLVFEFSGCQDIDLQTLESYPNQEDDKCITALKEIKFADQFADQGRHRLFDSRFIDTVYKKMPSKKNYFKNWKCIPKRPEDSLRMGILIDEPHWILYPFSGVSGALQALEITETEPGLEDFIRNLSVFYENDNEIKIQVLGKRGSCVTCQSLGFRNNKAKTWKTFIEILQNSPHTYCIGPAYKYIQVYSNSDKIEDEETKPKYSKKGERNREYDKRLKRLGAINKILVPYLNDHYPIKIPSDFKLYELCPDEKPGTYTFKFKVTSGEKESTKDKVLNEFERLTKKYRETNNNSLLEKISPLVITISENEWLPKDEIANAVQSDQ